MGEDERVGERVGAYVIDGQLGSGGMGVVHAAHDAETGERVALKMLSASVAGDDRVVTRFLREAQAASTIDHPNVARVFAQGRLQDGSLYTVMELLEGVSLSTIIKSKAPMPIGEAVGLALQACAGVGAAHRAGVIHRDLKPSNIIVVPTENGPQLKLVDFGIAKATSAFGGGAEITALTNTGSVLGTPHYMSPEQVKDSSRVDGRSDIWALGVLLFKMLSGESPFAARTNGEYVAEIFTDAPRPLSAVRADVPEALAEVVRKCLQREPEARFATVEELAEAIAPFSTEPGTRPSIPTAAPRRPSSHPSRRPESGSPSDPTLDSDGGSLLPVRVASGGTSPMSWLATPAGQGLGVAMALGLALIGVVVLWSEPSASDSAGEPSAATASEGEAEARTYLAQAIEYLEDGDFQKAHNIVQSIPASSPVHDSAESSRVENAWADWLFERAAAAEDPHDKRMLLNTISETTTVSLDRRKKAAEMALALPPTRARPLPSPDEPNPDESRRVAVSHGFYDDDGARASAGPERETLEPNPAKAGLMARMQSGTASPEELLMLKALCMADKDIACRNAAYAAWKRVRHRD